MEAAIEHLTAAYALDSSYVSVLLWAAVAHLNLGQGAQADSLAEIVNRSRDLLSSFDRELLSWLFASRRGDLQETWRISRELSQHSTKLKYQFANEAIGVNRPREAVAALESIDPTKGFMKQWVPYWSQLTEARHIIGDHGSELTDARRAREQHPDNRQTLLLELQALAALGRSDEVRMLLDEVLTLPPRASWGHAWEAAVAGAELQAHGHTEVAVEFFQLALDRLRNHFPNTGQSAGYQYNVGRLLVWSGQYYEARSVFLGLRAANPDNVDYAGHLAGVSARLGDVAAASRISDELAAFEQPTVGYRTRWRARIAALIGERERAVELLRQSFNEGLGYGIILHRDPDLESLRHDPVFQEFMRPKG